MGQTAAVDAVLNILLHASPVQKIHAEVEFSFVSQALGIAKSPTLMIYANPLIYLP